MFHIIMGHIHGKARWCFFLAPLVMLGEVLRGHMLKLVLLDRNPNGLEPATLITRITRDDTQMQNLVMLVTYGFMHAPMLLIGGVVMSMIVCPDLAPSLFMIITGLIIFLLIVVKRSIPRYTKMRRCQL